MIEETGAMDVYFEEEIEILMPDAGELSTETAKRILAENEVEFTRIERDNAD